jgi:hypothetical protein
MKFVVPRRLVLGVWCTAADAAECLPRDLARVRMTAPRRTVKNTGFDLASSRSR